MLISKHGLSMLHVEHEIREPLEREGKRMSERSSEVGRERGGNTELSGSGG